MMPTDLKSARDLLGWTQRRLAEELGVPQATIWRWEAGKTAIQHPRILLLALHALSDAYGVDRRPSAHEDYPDPEF